MKMIRRIVALTFAGLLCAAFSFTALGAAKEEKTAYSFTYAEQQVTPGGLHQLPSKSLETIRMTRCLQTVQMTAALRLPISTVPSIW